MHVPFAGEDAKETPGVAIVNEAFARKYFAAKDPLGQHFRRGADRPWIQIVGVVKDLRRDGLTASMDPQVYLAAAQTSLYPVRLADLAVRVAGDPSLVVKPLQAAVWSVDAEQPLANVRTLADTVDATLAPRRFQTLLLSLFAGGLRSQSPPAALRNLDFVASDVGVGRNRPRHSASVTPPQ